MGPNEKSTLRSFGVLGAIFVIDALVSDATFRILLLVGVVVACLFLVRDSRRRFGPVTSVETARQHFAVPLAMLTGAVFVVAEEALLGLTFFIIAVLMMTWSSVRLVFIRTPESH